MTQTYRQMMLLQLQGYILWSNAYGIVNRDSSGISDRYAGVLENQRNYLQDATCQVNIPHSINLLDCEDGYYLHKSLTADVTCKTGYFVKGT